MLNRRHPPLRPPQLMLLEIVLCVLIIGVALTRGLVAGGKCRDLAELLEALYGSDGLRLASVEHLAITGTFAGATGEFATDASPILEQSLLQERARFSYHETDSIVRATGTIPYPRRKVTLTFRAAVSEQEIPLYVVWLCGNRSAPSGLTADRPADRGDSPPELMPFNCRDTGAP